MASGSTEEYNAEQGTVCAAIIKIDALYPVSLFVLML
jgi:hypothetical protein